MKDVYISKRRIIILLFFYALTLTCLVQKTFGQVNPTLNTYGVPGLIDMPIASSFDENSNFNSEKVSDELSHPINGLIVGSEVLNSNIHLLFFANPDCIGFLFGM